MSSTECAAARAAIAAMKNERFPGASQLAASKMRHRARRDIDDI
jgi:hypothetical protein